MPLRSGGRPAASRRAFQAWSRCAHLARGAHRPLGVVGGGDGRAEHRLDLVADELEHEAAVRADGLVHLGEVLVEVAHHLARLGGLHPRREVAQVREQDGGLDELALAADAPGQDRVTDLGRDVLAEGLLDHLALAQAVQHAVEALGHRADLVGAHHGSAAVEPAPLHLGHRVFHVLERRGHAVGREDGEADRGDDADSEQEEDRHLQAVHDHGGGDRVDADQGHRARVGQHAQHRERDHTDEQEDGEQPDAHRQPGHALHRAQVALREEMRQAPPPLMLGREEDEGGGHAARDDGVAEERAQRAIRREDPGQQRPDDSPDEAGQRPAEEAEPGEKVWKQQRPTAHQLGLRGREAG